MAHSHGQAGHQVCGQPAFHSTVPTGLVTVIHPREDEVHGGPFGQNICLECRTNIALPLIKSCEHSLVSHPSFCHQPILTPGPRSGTKDNQLLAPEGLRTAARDICHRGGQAGARQKGSALVRRLEFGAGCRPGWGIGAFQRSMAMVETHHISHSGGRLRAPRECQNLPAVGQGGYYVLCPTLVRSG